jgi:phosphatidate cytidylyltransferase
MPKRIFSTLTLWALVFACIYFFGASGGVWLLTLIAAFTLREFYALIRKMGHQPFDCSGILLGLAIMLSPLYLEPLPLFRDRGTQLTSAFLALAVIVFAVRILKERSAESRVESLAWSIAGIAYVPFMLHFLVRIILIPGPHAGTGLAFCLWLIAVSKFCDVGALLSGMAFGKHKMAPVISPKKTWEGAIGGVIVSAGLGAAIAHCAARFYPIGFTPLAAALAAAPIAVLAIVSDLVESIVKRRANSKDSGNTIPGIGGVFDLSDSLILTAPVGYIVFSLL